MTIRNFSNIAHAILSELKLITNPIHRECLYSILLAFQLWWIFEDFVAQIGKYDGRL